MKKNWMLRAGVLMLALTLMTSCFVGGTFAKYTTSGETESSARVAVFGVTVTGAGSIFAKEYKDPAGAKVTVQSATDVVAPGTSGTLADIKITGTPEVAVKVTHEATTFEVSNWKNSKGEFYCPIVIYVGNKYINGLDYTDEETFESEVKTVIADFSEEYAPGTNLATGRTDTQSISWRWAFEGQGGGAISQNDSDDTFLGNWATQIGSAPTINLTVTTTVTQID